VNKRAFLLGAAMVFLVNFVATALRPYAENAFLDSYDKASLPWLFVANAAGFAIATIGYDLITRRAHTRVVDLGLLVAMIATMATAPMLLRAGAPPVFLVVAVTALTQVVGLALWNRVAEAVAGRDARRNLPRAGAGVTAGGMIAGLGAGLLGIKGDLLPYLGAGVSVIVVGLVVAQARALKAGGAPGAALPPGASDTLNPLHLRLRRALIAVALLEGVFATLVDFQFLAELRVETGDKFTSTLLLFSGGTNAVLLLLQATAVPRLLVTRSLPTTGGVHPTLVILWYVAFMFAPGLLTIAGTRTTDQVFRAATSRTAQEVSLSAFPPLPRARWKVLLRGAIWPLGAAVAALALVVIGPVAFQRPIVLAGAAIAIAVVWWIAARISARRFQTALAAPLAIGAQRTIDDPTRIDLATLEHWTHVSGDDDPATAALGRAALSRAQVDASQLADQLRHDEPAVRAALFDQIARAPSPALVRELRAAVQIEDDDRALVLGLKALAIAGDDGGLERGRSRAALSRDVAEAVKAAELTLRGGPEVAIAIDALCERDPSWAVALIRAERVREAAGMDPATSRPRSQHPPIDDAALAKLLEASSATPARRAGALVVIAHVGPPAALPLLDEALAASDPDAIRAIAALDPPGLLALSTALGTGSAKKTGMMAALRLRRADQAESTDGELDASGALQTSGAHRVGPTFGPLARLTIARALAATPNATEAVGKLLEDPDPEVAHAALRTALAIARGGASLPSAPIAIAHRAAAGALVATLDARDAAHAASLAPEPTAMWSACARHELELATRSCVARLMWATAVEVAAAGRDPAAIAATARRLIGGREPDRRRALDVIQELQAGRVEILAVIERWLRPAAAKAGSPDALALHDPWLARLCRGELAALEPTLTALRKPALFATITGPALAALAARSVTRTVDGELFAAAVPGSTMFVLAKGTLIAHREPAPPRRIEAGGVVGELAVLTGAPRAATVITDGPADVIEIDRASFDAAARRAPELVLGLSATLAGWLAPNRPDVL
jgi:CRP-like cAMP-binding protein